MYEQTTKKHTQKCVNIMNVVVAEE